MIIRKNGKCHTCKTPVQETREFLIAVDLFAPQAEGVPTDVKKKIVRWREERMYCRKHDTRTAAKRRLAR